VSIGAITATLLARPKGGDSLKALTRFWEEVAVSGVFFPPPLRPYASFFGNRHFFVPRLDYFALPLWTSLYDLSPLRATLRELVNEDALADRNARPRLLVTATEVVAGQIKCFDSADGLTLDHVLASCSLPPSFPATRIDKIAYWDGGLFDNTPLGFVLDRLDGSAERKIDREVIVVNLFPNVVKEPENLAEVAQRKENLLFSNKTASDLKLLKKFNGVAGLLKKIRTEQQWADLRASKEFEAADQGYIEVPEPIAITRSRAVEQFEGADFSPKGIESRAREGARAAREELARHSIKLDLAADAL
jgi:predicted acylesterase/phospholipase RssA